MGRGREWEVGTACSRMEQHPDLESPGEAGGTHCALANCLEHPGTWRWGPRPPESTPGSVFTEEQDQGGGGEFGGKTTDVSGGRGYNQQSVTQARCPCLCLLLEDPRSCSTFLPPPSISLGKSPFLPCGLCHPDSQPFRACQHGLRSSLGDKAVPRATAWLTLDG